MKKSFLLIAVIAAMLFTGFTYSDAIAQGSIEGVVLDADGEAVAGAEVAITGDMRHGDRPYRDQTQTGDDGSFGFDGVPAGEYMIVAVDRELGMARDQIEVADDNVTNVELQLGGRQGDDENGIGSVSGSVVNQNGEDVAGAHIVLQSMNHDRGDMMRPMTTQSDREGAFSFDEVPAGNYIVAAMTRDGMMAHERIAVAADENTEVELTIRRVRRPNDDGENDQRRHDRRRHDRRWRDRR